MGSQARRILVVEDDALLRELIATALRSRGFEVASAATAAEARKAFPAEDPDGAVLDVNLGPGPTGFDLAVSLRGLRPGLPIVFLTNLPDARFASGSEADVPTGVAYLRKTAISDIDSLVGALDEVLRGKVTGANRHDRDRDRPLAHLTRNQVAVLTLLAEGRTNAQIAQERGISVKAVEEVLGRIFDALGLASATDGNLRVAAARRYLSATGGSTTS